MQYISTRGQQSPLPFSETVLQGLCSDGGLAMPVSIPHIALDTLKTWQTLSYPELAFEIMQLFIDDIPKNDLKNILTRAYTAEKFGSSNIIELKKINPNRYILGLSNGPTIAFKDMAMQFLGELFEYVLDKKNQTVTIVGATSGDTGSSAIHAMRGKSRIKVFMLSPHKKMSPFQAAQMYSVTDSNIVNIAVNGVFDDCQDMVKALNNDSKFKQKHHISAVNSINWARILAQMVYYFKGYLALIQTVAQPIGTKVDFVVPSGNFGNIFAGVMAKKMGLPIGKLILATNENNVLDEFFKTDIYKPRKTNEVFKTSSPSMDIAKASNFERFLYLIFGADKTLSLMQDVDKYGYFDLSKDPDWQTIKQNWIISGTSTHQNRLDTIKQINREAQFVIDPHTADGVFVGNHFLSDTLQLCLETALPTKFEDCIFAALGAIPTRAAHFVGIEALPQQYVVIENDEIALKEIIEQN